MKRAGGVATFSSFANAVFGSKYPSSAVIPRILIMSVRKELVANYDKQQLLLPEASIVHSLSVPSLA